MSTPDPSSIESDPSIEASVEAWCSLDERTALLTTDREIIAASRSIRALIVAFSRSGGADEEIYDACAALGRLIAEHRGSATLASSTLDNASSVLGAREAPWLPHARAAVVEAFTFTLVERAKHEGFQSWDFPACAITLPDDAIAIAAGHPSNEPEDLSAWAARIAHAAALKGVRRAFIAGPALPRRAIEEALDLVGIAYDGSRT
jgi:hypothetical protein